MTTNVPIWIEDPVNAAILAVSEDRLQGFQLDPFGEIARRSGIDVDTVIERIVAMLRAGTIRRVRQTLMATNLADGALCAWQVAAERLDDAFAWLSEVDPFSGHVVIRTTDSVTAGSNYRLWTTLKVPQGYDIAKYAGFLAQRIGAERHRLMPARALFVLGVGHVRRRGLEPGARAPEPADVKDTEVVALSPREWDVLAAIKREFGPQEIVRDLWRARAEEAGVPLAELERIGRALN
ncbi:MAG: Lrp/AsnC family transcriptional regulator, partial [Candidatus Eremiobacteraeota bacterium]|nr:Lrp/AsnC family transcriptional regulator [Candidatus Eremiobacteraeota bacterium]